MINKQELEKYNNLIWSIVHKILTKVGDSYYYKGLEEDLFQEGYIGLLCAFEKYDETLKIQFSTFAYKYIYGYCSNYIRKEYSSLKCEDIDTTPINTDAFYEIDDYFEFDLIEELNKKLEIVGKKVSEADEKILRNRLYDGYSLKKCAELSNCSSKKITYTIERYKNLIKEILDK